MSLIRVSYMNVGVKGHLQEKKLGQERCVTKNHYEQPKLGTWSTVHSL